MALDWKAINKELEAHRAKVDVDSFDIPVRELVRMVAQNELVISPEYQRQFRWKEDDESRLIESLFLGLPVPPIFVATNDDQTWELVDGLQRVSSLIHFFGDDALVTQHTGRKKPLLLSGLEKLSALNGAGYESLRRPMRLLLERRYFRVSALSDKSDFQVRFTLFERLNRGGIALSNQEIRNVVYRGPLLDLVNSLASDPKFRSLLKLKRTQLKDGTFQEQVLKAFAYTYQTSAFADRVSAFLNDFCDWAIESLDLKEAKAAFESTVDFLADDVLEGSPFLRRGYATTPLNQFEAVFSAVMSIFLAGEKPKVPTTGWELDEELLKYSKAGTNTRRMLSGRLAASQRLFR